MTPQEKADAKADEKPEGWEPPGPLPSVTRPEEEDADEPPPKEVDTKSTPKDASENPEDFDQMKINNQPVGQTGSISSPKGFTKEVKAEPIDPQNPESKKEIPAPAP